MQRPTLRSFSVIPLWAFSWFLCAKFHIFQPTTCPRGAFKQLPYSWAFLIEYFMEICRCMRVERIARIRKIFLVHQLWDCSSISDSDTWRKVRVSRSSVFFNSLIEQEKKEIKWIQSKFNLQNTNHTKKLWTKRENSVWLICVEEKFLPLYQPYISRVPFLFLCHFCRIKIQYLCSCRSFLFSKPFNRLKYLLLGKCIVFFL